MAEGSGCAGPSIRYFCTAGRGLEPFLLREVRARLGATQVEYVSGKVFFTTNSELSKLKKLKSGERLFLLLKKHAAISPSRNKGKVFNEIQKLVIEDPRCWLDIISIWKRLHGNKVEQGNLSKENPESLKRKSEEEISIIRKKQKEQILETVSDECHVEEQKKSVVLETNDDMDFLTERKTLLEETSESRIEKSVDSNNHSFSFRVSCRCSGAIAKVFTSQEVGRVLGITLVKQLGWQTDLRNPDLELFVHLNDIYSVVGIPVFRLPLATREYIQTAGLRSTVAWAMASLAEINAGAFVLDPMCGLGTILLEAAKEWPNVHYLGADINDSQLQGAHENIKAAGLMDKIELLKASVIALPLPSESVDVVISDIPFGKKFKITKDIKLLPDILREMERVLHVGGTVVLLVSQDVRKHMGGCISNCVENDTSLNATSDNRNGAAMVKDLNPKEENGSPRSISSSIKGVETEHFNNITCFGSLAAVESYGISLGKTDAFIYKYRKMPAAGMQ
ncbi:U6 snRNA (guanine-N(2))-methyltransferase THUMPD2 isoform X1 [Chelonoidis abingdonii]|uniref:U6 snRNA (guanine-N(2))-methyltransferase THUMPD2 isoform X1 n=1 Tax=Chelonoidis abingdonii TaxID=106734 RepID=UPI0013F1B464|nr:THUMP domain-containing protein 2 isoform X1 [Chelonoidis abingdonii]